LVYPSDWCGREDSNFHGIAPTATSTLRVYQFRHDRIFGRIAIIRNLYCGERYQIAIVIARLTTQMSTNSVEWKDCWEIPTDYDVAVTEMEQHVGAIRDGTTHQRVWLVVHPPIYTAGTAARPDDLLNADRFPVIQTGRGGQYTYHGPGQLVAYAMLDLTQRGSDVRKYVHDLEQWAIDTLAEFGVRGERREGRVGIWVDRGRDSIGNTVEAKISAIGVRVRRWVSYHGISINVEPDLEHFSGIVPCGIQEHGVTSLVDLGIPVTMADVAHALRTNFETTFDNKTVEV
jgi:lipoyl(octanoyl) transferase